MKVSWVTSAGSVRHECEVLKYLEKYNVKGVERCIASGTYEPPKMDDVSVDPTEVETPSFFPSDDTASSLGDGPSLLVTRGYTPEVGSSDTSPKKETSFLVSLYEEDEAADKRIKVTQRETKRVAEKQRAMIVLDPYFQTSKPSKSTLQDIGEKSVKVKAVHNLISTMVEMLSAGAAGSDLQPLMDVDTGSNNAISNPTAICFSI